MLVIAMISFLTTSSALLLKYGYEWGEGMLVSGHN
jgi:hypothetical protein